MVKKDYNYKESLKNEKKVFESCDSYIAFPSSVYKDIIRKFGIKKGSVGLEMCCAEGAFSKYIEGCTIDGIDIARNLLDKAKHLRKTIEGDAHYPQHYFKEKYDWVCFFSALHHLREYPIALYNCDKLIKKGGKILFFEPNVFHPQRFIFINNDLWWGMAKGERGLNPYKIKELLDFLDYKIIKFKFISYPYIKMGLCARLQQVVKYIPSKFFQTFWIMVAEKN